MQYNYNGINFPRLGLSQYILALGINIMFIRMLEFELDSFLMNYTLFLLNISTRGEFS